MNTTNSQNAVLCTFSIPTNPTGLLSAPCPDYLYDCKFSAQYRRNKTKDDDFKLLSLEFMPPMDFKQLYPHAEPASLELLRRMLAFSRIVVV